MSPESEFDVIVCGVTSTAGLVFRVKAVLKVPSDGLVPLVVPGFGLVVTIPSGNG